MGLSVIAVSLSHVGRQGEGGGKWGEAFQSPPGLKDLQPHLCSVSTPGEPHLTLSRERERGLERAGQSTGTLLQTHWLCNWSPSWGQAALLGVSTRAWWWACGGKASGWWRSSARSPHSQGVRVLQRPRSKGLVPTLSAPPAQPRAHPQALCSSLHLLPTHSPTPEGS